MLMCGTATAGTHGTLPVCIDEPGSPTSTMSSANSVSDFTSHVARLRSRSSSGRRAFRNAALGPADLVNERQGWD